MRSTTPTSVGITGTSPSSLGRCTSRPQGSCAPGCGRFGARSSGQPRVPAVAEHRSDRVLGNIGTRVLFEDERVRVWQLRLAPGEDSATHRHDLDHLLIQVAGDRIAVIPEPDSEGPYRDYLEADVVPGT